MKQVMKRISLFHFLIISFLMSSCGLYKNYERPADIITDGIYGDMQTAGDNSLGDLIRYTAMAPSHDKLGETCNNVVDGLKKAGYHIVEVDNKWTNPKDGYHGLHLAVVTPDWSQQFELQSRL